MRTRLRAVLRAAAVAGGLGASAGCFADTDLPPDEIPPQVQVTEPLDGATVGGGVTITVSALDNFSVEVVRILIDGTLRATFFARPYHFVWSTIPLPDNSVHTIVAEAVDPSQNVGRAEISVTVMNGTNLRP